MFFLNLSCFIIYWIIALVFMFCLYYFKVLPNNTKIRFQYNPIDFVLDSLKILSFDLQNFDPETFVDTGIVVYEGPQGSGKTLSMVYDILRLENKYKKLKVMDNFGLSEKQIEHPSDLVDFQNGHLGVITSIDEMGIWFNNRDFKHFSETGMLQVIFENRKVRRLLVGTTQKFFLIDKNIRVQTSEVRSAHTFGGFLTYYVRKIPNVDADGNVLGYRFKGIRFFIQSNELRNCYDTYKVIRKFKDKGYKYE